MCNEVMQSHQDKPIRVLFYEPYPMGLSGNFLTQWLILERLDRAQFTPIVMSLVEGVALEEFRKMGVECVVISPPGDLDRYGGNVLRNGILGRMKTAIDLLRYNLTLARFFRERQINVVYANCVRAEMSIGLAARLTGVPSLLYIKSELKNPIIDFLSFLAANRILFMCKSNYKLKYARIMRLFEYKISILEGGLEPIELNLAFNADKSRLRNELDLDPEKFNVCVVGQISPMKGQRVVVKALSKMVKYTKKIQLYFVGDTPIEEYKWYMETVKNDLVKLDLSRFVVFLGWRNDALNIMSCMDLLINPSLAEGFGYVPLEGMALGLPVIATRVGVLPEAITDGVTGFLVKSGDDEGIVRCWRSLISDPALCERMGKNARSKIFSEYLIDDKVDRLAQIWTDMVRASS